jgi:hypothetical protein
VELEREARATSWAAFVNERLRTGFGIVDFFGNSVS